MPDHHARSISAEGLGTAFLLMAVVGSGIMGERLAGGNVALALLANTLATGAALVALILTFGPISGAHLNPVVTIADAWQGGLAWREVPGYLTAQLGGALIGVAVAHLMFGEAIYSVPRHVRQGPAQLLSEFVATFGLVTVIGSCARHRASAVPFAVGAYIAAAYWFTASTSFANPAVTLARAASDTFVGIRPADVPGFIAAQALGGAAGVLVVRWLTPLPPTPAAALISEPKSVGSLSSSSGSRARAMDERSPGLRVRLATAADAAAIADIYNQGIEERIATFETALRSPQAVEAQLAEKGDRFPTVVVERDGQIVSWASAGPYRARPAYAGVAEHSVYVARHARGTGAGRMALEGLAREYEARGFWKLVSRIFPENTASLTLHERAGFRTVGIYRRHGQLEGHWRDCVIVEKLLDRATHD